VSNFEKRNNEIPYQWFKIMGYENIVRPHISMDNATYSAFFMKIT
jgi:hypothetical protein